MLSTNHHTFPPTESSFSNGFFLNLKKITVTSHTPTPIFPTRSLFARTPKISRMHCHGSKVSDVDPSPLGSTAIPSCWFDPPDAYCDYCRPEPPDPDPGPPEPRKYRSDSFPETEESLAKLAQYRSQHPAMDRYLRRRYSETFPPDHRGFTSEYMYWSCKNLEAVRVRIGIPAHIGDEKTPPLPPQPPPPPISRAHHAYFSRPPNNRTRPDFWPAKPRQPTK